MRTGIKDGLYRIQILCRHHPFWTYPTGLTLVDPPGKQKLRYRRVYAHRYRRVYSHHTNIGKKFEEEQIVMESEVRWIKKDWYPGKPLALFISC